MLSNLLGFLTLLPLAVLANSHGSVHHDRHAELAKRSSGDVQLHRRFASARWTFYDVGLGACGKSNVASDFIVALNTPQFKEGGGGYPGSHCFQTISMTFNGKTTQATVMDECPGCPYGGLDLSRGLFNFFASESEGVLYGTWSFGGGGAAPPPPPPPPPPKTTWKPVISIPIPWKPEPTTTPKPEPTTTWTPPSTTSTKPESTSSSVPSSSAPKSSTSTSTTPTSIPVPTAKETPLALSGLNVALISLAKVLVVAGSA